jgi:hypothetical protein
VLGSSILEVALGLGLFFLLLAVICTSINEIVARVLALRARTLRTGVGELLGDPNVQGIAQSVYTHPLIAALERKHRPSYIHARTFSAALLDTVSTGATTVAEVHAAIANNPNVPEDLKRQLAIIISDANDDLAALRQGIGVWFDDAMSRVGGWYKRKTQLITFAVATFLVLLLNADSLALADAMLKNPAAREAFVAQASALVPTGTDGVPETDVAAVRAALDPIGLELGWDDVDAGNPLGWYLAPANWLGHLPGWAITIFAVLLGAPFWFDILSKVSNIRSTGQPPPQTSSALPSGT